MLNLSEREKRLIQALLIVVIAIALYFLIISPVLSYRERIDMEYENNVSRLMKLDRLYEEFREIKQEKQRKKALLNNTSGVTTLIEENAEKAGILGNKIYTRDNPLKIQDDLKKVSTDVKFEGVSISPFMKFIYLMENSDKMIKVNYLQISLALKGRNTYDVRIKFDSLTSR